MAAGEDSALFAFGCRDHPMRRNLFVEEQHLLVAYCAWTINGLVDGRANRPLSSSLCGRDDSPMISSRVRGSRSGSMCRTMRATPANPQDVEPEQVVPGLAGWQVGDASSRPLFTMNVKTPWCDWLSSRCGIGKRIAR